MITLLGRRMSRALFTLALSIGAWSAAGAGTLGTLAMSPNRIIVGQAQAVTFSISITDPKYLVGSGNVQRLRADGSVAAVLGNLRDDGLGGDAVAGDKIYALRVTLNESQPGTVGLRVSAGFRGELRRSASNTQTLTIDAVAAPALASASPAPEPARSRAAPSLTVQFRQCTEFVGLAPVDAAKARAAVPANFEPVVDADGARLVVRVADCAAVQVGSLPARPAKVAQIGVLIASPDGTATDPNTSINNYALTYATDSLALATGLRAAGVPAALDQALAYEVNPATGGGSEFYAAVAPEPGASAAWFLHGSVNTPGFVSSFLANWWRIDGSHEVKMATTLPVISFDFGSQVAFTTSRHGVVGALLPANRLATFPLSFRGSFDAATMVVTGRR